MRSIGRYVPAFVFLVGCAFMWNARSQRSVPLAAPLAGVMADYPGYRMREQTLADDEKRGAGMNDYVARMFWRDSAPAFSIFVSYYERQTQGRTIHSPRNCLPGAGWEVRTSGIARLATAAGPQTVNRYVLKNERGATAVVYYWYQGRGRVVANEYAVKWNLLRDAAVAGHTEEALVRVVVPVVGESVRATADATALGADVATKLLADVSRALPHG